MGSASPLLAGLFMGVGQYFMGRLANGLPMSESIWHITRAALVSPHAYGFIVFNLVATVLYFLSLRNLPLTHAYVMFVASMSVTILSFDLYANKVAFSTLSILGIALGLAGILLLAATR
jgi:multidrug transporter EmrE-like cation transporter